MYIMMPLKNWAALFYQLSRRYLDLDSVLILCSAGATNSIWVLMMRSSSLLASWTAILVPLCPVLVIENLMVCLSWVLAKYSCSLLRRADILLVSRLSLPWYSPCVSWSWCWPLNWVSPGYNGCRTAQYAFSYIIHFLVQVTGTILYDVALQLEAAREVRPGWWVGSW